MTKPTVKVPDAGYMIALQGGTYVASFPRGRGPLSDSDALKRAMKAAQELANNAGMRVEVVSVSARGQDRHIIDEITPSHWKREAAGWRRT